MAAAPFLTQSRKPRTVDEKADLILLEGRLNVERITFGPLGRLVVAACRSTDGVTDYHLGFDPAKDQWRCTCISGRHGRCSHLVALRRIVHP